MIQILFVSLPTHLYRARLLPKFHSRLSVDSFGNFPITATPEPQLPPLWFQNETRSRLDRRPSTSQIRISMVSWLGKENVPEAQIGKGDRKSTRLNSSHLGISYAVFC